MKETLRFLAAWWCWTVLAFGQGGATFVPRTLPQLTDVADTATPTAGRILYGNGTAWTALAPGTSGQVLSINGSGLPIWSSSGGGVNEASDYDWTGTHTFGGTLTIGADGGITADGGLALTGYIDPTGGTLVLGSGTGGLLDLSTGTATGAWNWATLGADLVNLREGGTTLGAVNIVEDSTVGYGHPGHHFLVNGLNMKASGSTGYSVIDGTKEAWGFMLERSYLVTSLTDDARGSVQHEGYLTDGGSFRPFQFGYSTTATATVTGITSPGTNAVVAFTPPSLADFLTDEDGNTLTGLRFKFTALVGASGISTETWYYLATKSGNTFTFATSYANAVAGTPLVDGTATSGTMQRGGYGLTNVQTGLIVYPQSYDHPETAASGSAIDVRSNSTSYPPAITLTNYTTGGSYIGYDSLWRAGEGTAAGGTAGHFVISQLSSGAKPWFQINPIGANPTGRVAIGYATATAAASELDVNGTVTATAFSGSGASLTSVNAATFTVADESADTTCFPLFVTAATGSLAGKTNARLSFNSSTGATLLDGDFTLAEGKKLAIQGSVAGKTTFEPTSASFSDNTILTPITSGTLALTSDITGGTQAGSFTTLSASGVVTLSASSGSITGGTANAGSLTISSGSAGNSRTLILQTTTSGGTPTTALTLNDDQSATFAGTITVPSGSGFRTTSNGTFRATADGEYVVSNAVGSNLFRLTGTADTVTIRNGAGSADGALVAGAITGAAGGFTTLAASRLASFGSTQSATAWTTTGIAFNEPAASYTDSSSSGTVAVTTINNIAQPTLLASSATTYTDSFVTRLAGPPVASTNVTQTRAHTLGILDSTSAASSITGGLVVATAFGTSATSVGIGGGTVYAGTSLVSSGLVQGQYFRNGAFIDYGDGGTKIAKINYNGGQELTALKLGGTTTGMRLVMASDGNVTLTDSAGTASTGNLTLNNLIAGGNTTLGSGGTAISKHLSATATLNYDLTALTLEDKTVTVTGAALGDSVAIGVPHGSTTATSSFTAWVSASDTVTIRCKTAATGEDPASGTFRADVWKH